MLKAKVVLPDGMQVKTDEGLPQGGPLSPLLSNIVLNELDRELERRGHRFCRYADDVNIYIRSERAGQRVMSSIARFIKKRLRLQVNPTKSAVALPKDRHFLGFCLRYEAKTGNVEIGLSERSKKQTAERIRALTPRRWGQPLKVCIERINTYLRGWMGFFGICTNDIRWALNKFDAHIRRRLRVLQMRQWGRRRTIARKLVSLGAKRKTAWQNVYEGRRSLWALSRTTAAERGMRNAYFAERGLESLMEKRKRIQESNAAPKQLNFLSQL